MDIKFCVKPSLEKLKESDGFGAEIEVEINGKEFVLALCYIVQALAAILATVTFAVASCDEIPYVLEKFEEDERRVRRRNCRDGRLRVGFGTYEPMSPVVFKKEGDYLVIEAFENDRLVGRERVKVREYVKAAVGFLEEYLKDATEDAYLTALEGVRGPYETAGMKVHWGGIRVSWSPNSSGGTLTTSTFFLFSSSGSFCLGRREIQKGNPKEKCMEG